ncbi:MAG: acyltransferase family protein, partial [Deltaproteobacteria bacterium]
MFGLGLLRTILAVAVVIVHSSGIFGYNVVGGMVAVQSFYIISGFYMSLILNEKYTDLYVFYTNRILRLYPIYLVVVLLTLIISYADLSNKGDWNSLFYYFKYYGQMGFFTLI